MSSLKLTGLCQKVTPDWEDHEVLMFYRAPGCVEKYSLNDLIKLALVISKAEVLRGVAEETVNADRLDPKSVMDVEITIRATRVPTDSAWKYLKDTWGWTPEKARIQECWEERPYWPRFPSLGELTNMQTMRIWKKEHPIDAEKVRQDMLRWNQKYPDLAEMSEEEMISALEVTSYDE